MEKLLSLEVYYTLKRATYCIKNDLHNQLGDLGVTWPQFHALYHIEDQGVPANELAKELNCNASNMTGLVDRMMENQWVYRERSQEDRRVWLIKLTEKGKNLKTRLIPEYHNNIHNRMSVLNEQELLTLKTLLEKLIDGEMKEQKS